MDKYFYKCSGCNQTYDQHSIEGQFVYLCPACGKAERYKPLVGVLSVEYDYKKIGSTLNSEQFLDAEVGNYKSFESLLPLKSISDQNNILLNPRTYPIKYDNQLLHIFDDTLNPTLSYKDRATLLVCYKAIEIGLTNISAASTGNAGSSLAGITAKLGLNSHIFVPKRIPEAKRLQIQSFGANLYMVDGTYDDAFDLCTEVSLMNSWYNRNTAYNPMTIEGKKTAAYDIFISTKGKLPDSIYVPVGDGVIIAGLYKGFYDLKMIGLIDKIPNMIAVQAAGSNALVRYMNENSFEFISTSTLADSIDAAAPRNLYQAVQAVKESEGIAIDVDDAEIIAAQKILVSQFGVMCEPSAASVFAEFLKMQKNGAEKYLHNVLLMITGNGLKDTNSLKLWNENPDSRSVDDWKKLLHK